jgi:hypothetical protein
MASFSILEALDTLLSSAPEWIARLDEVNDQIALRQIDLSRLTGDKHVKKYVDEGETRFAQYSFQSPAFPTAVPGVKWNSNPPLQESLNRQSSQPAPPTQSRLIPTSSRKQQTQSVDSRSPGESIRPKFKSRSMIIVYYDSAVQFAFEEMVKSISGSRNAMRKGKMAVKMAQMRRVAELEVGIDSEDENKGIDAAELEFGVDKEEHYYDIDMPRLKFLRSAENNNDDGEGRTPKLKPSKLQFGPTRQTELVSNTRSGTEYRRTQAREGPDILDELDKGLEKCQGLCEHAAHQFLRDGECTNEINNIKKELEKVVDTAGNEIEKLRREAPSPSTKLPKPPPGSKPMIPKRVGLFTRKNPFEDDQNIFWYGEGIAALEVEHGKGDSTTGTEPKSSPQTAPKPLTDPHSHPIIASRSRLKVFAIDTVEDKDLILLWQDKILPAVKSLLHKGNDKSISISLLREGTSLEESEPVIRIQTSIPRSTYQQTEVKNALLEASPLFTPKIHFVVGSVRRTGKRSDLDLEPCLPRNTDFALRPYMGASIGVDGSEKDTATLGGYISINETPHILTVYHLFENEDDGLVYGPGTIITQPSLQEPQSQQPLIPITDLSADKSEQPSDISSRPSSFSFGSLTYSSGFRNRPRKVAASNVEMDWAICKVEAHRLGSNTSPCQKHVCRNTSQVIPGGSVFAIGRTSGRQEGIINGCMTNLRFWEHEFLSRESDEWAVIRPDLMSEESWATGGIGVSGDSGAWVLETGTDNVIGQVWGRDFQEDHDSLGQIITYFTPMLDIFDDILEITKASRISLYISEDGHEQGSGQKQETLADPIRHGMRLDEPAINRGMSRDLKTIELVTALIHVSDSEKPKGDSFELTRSSTRFYQN